MPRSGAAGIEWNAPTGRPKALTLEQAVKATLIYFKNNVTEDVIAELMFVDQATISHVEVLGRDTAVLTGVHALGGGWPCP